MQLPTVLGLKVRQMQTETRNSNSLLKQQLRSGLKDIDIMANTGYKSTQSHEKSNSHSSSIDACSALQSLATVAAERQAPSSIQPPSANNLQHQFLLHMAANPLHKTAANDYYQQRTQEQEQEQQQQLEQQQQQFKSEQQQQQQVQQEDEEEQQLQLHISEREDNISPTTLDIILDQNDKSDPELTLADETAGLDYRSSENNSVNDSGKQPTTAAGVDGDGSNAETPVIQRRSRNSGDSAKQRPVQRRRARRKAQSTIDDQAEHLTEMSVRGLDLFRYASITEGVYQCTECAKENLQKTFKNKYSFQRHAFLYHEGKHRKVFPCPLCGKEFSRPDKMKNHLKMTHESFVAKDMSSFSPLNYLITAAAAGEIFAQQQQHPHHQSSSLLADGLMMQDDLAAGMNLSQTGHEQSPPRTPSPLQSHSPADALLKLHNDIVIKNEIVISPSPSPPPAAPTQAELAMTSATGARLEEVK